MSWIWLITPSLPILTTDYICVHINCVDSRLWQHNSRELDEQQWGRAAETVSGETAGNWPHAASAWGQDSAPAGGWSSYTCRYLNCSIGVTDLQTLTILLFLYLAGGPASTQWGWANGLTGWIAVTQLTPLPRHRYGGFYRGWEAPQHPVPIQHKQRQVQKISSAITTIKQPNPSLSGTDCVCLCSG